jgi:hypothetical protein
MSTKRQQEPLDRVAPGVMLLLAAVIAVMLLLGSQALPKVRVFSWQDKAVSSKDVAFMMTFTQPVEPESVEKNLKIEPGLAGKFSWAGRRMAYTLAVPAPYGETYRISLPKAQASNGQSGFEPFKSEFRTRDRVFAYIGAQGEEQGRLILFNLTRKQKSILTPAGQTVMDFRPYPERDRILFLAADNKNDGTIALPQLYSVSTGLAAETSSPPRWQFWRRQRTDQRTDLKTGSAAGKLKLILDNKEYQNLKFDLSADGKVIVIQRVNQKNPADFGPWVLIERQKPRKLKTEPGGDFKIAPDSASLLLQQGKGTAVIAIEPDVDELPADQSNALLDFLPDYGLTLDIASDGSAAALVNFNQDDPAKQFIQSLFWVSNRGGEKPLLQTNGAILNAQFNEDNSILYCLVNRLVDDGTEPNREGAPEKPEDLGKKKYMVVPYLTAINVKSGKEQKLLEMPPQPEITVSLSPDGLAVLFDEALASGPQKVSNSKVVNDFSGATHRLWLLPLFGTLEERLKGEPVSLPPTELEIAGRQPMWLP